MKILVCISVVPDTTTKITFTDNNTRLNGQGVQFIINPYDELALTRALEITEAGGGTVTVVHVGTAESEPSIRKALSIGAHDAVRIDAEPADAQFVAAEIAHWAKDQRFDMIMTGRESIDYNGGMVGGLIAELLGIPCVNVVTRVEVQNGKASLDRDIDGGRETLECPLPMVMSAQKDLCEPRIPNMRGIMAARTKPLAVIAAATQSGAVQYTSFDLPAAKQGVKLIEPERAADLIQILRNEAKVI
jgi:electron transfer flavoprotein beta subunit